MIIKNKISQQYKIKDTDLIFNSNNEQYVLKIRDIPFENKPREKMIRFGPDSLTIAELLAIILNTGNKEEDVLVMSNRIIREYGERSIIAEKNPVKFSKELNIPIVKSCQVIACGEIGRRLYEKNNFGFTVIRNAKDVYEYLKDMHDLPKENLRGIYLNSHGRIIHDEIISIGTINSNILHPREVFRPAIEYNAVAVILAHNHPSNIVSPSEQDIKITEQVIKAGEILGINLLDHVIITKNAYLSIKSNYK